MNRLEAVAALCAHDFMLDRASVPTAGVARAMLDLALEELQGVDEPSIPYEIFVAEVERRLHRTLTDIEFLAAFQLVDGRWVVSHDAADLFRQRLDDEYADQIQRERDEREDR